jgi:hypothetical protein
MLFHVLLLNKLHLIFQFELLNKLKITNTLVRLPQNLNSVTIGEMGCEQSWPIFPGEAGEA